MVGVSTPPSDEKEKQLRPRRRSFAQPSRPRSFWSQLSMVLLQPGAFFRALPEIQQGRGWLWAAILILALAALSAVRQAEPAPAPDAGIPQIPMDMGSGALGGVIGEPGFAPPESFAPPPRSEASTPDVSATWTTAILAAGGLVVQWLFLAVFLAEVSLLTSRTPRFSLNLHVAIWAGVPLGLMAGLQLLFYAAGGAVGEPGLSGLVNELPGFEQASAFVQEAIRALASRFTVFWLWSLALLYIGARQALGGKRWAVVLVLAIWVAALVLVPAIVSTLTGGAETGQPAQGPSFDGDIGAQEGKGDWGGDVGAQENLGILGGEAGALEGDLSSDTGAPESLESQEETGDTAKTPTEETGLQAGESTPLPAP